MSDKVDVSDLLGCVDTLITTSSSLHDVQTLISLKHQYRELIQLRDFHLSRLQSELDALSIQVEQLDKQLSVNPSLELKSKKKLLEEKQEKMKKLVEDLEREVRAKQQEINEKEEEARTYEMEKGKLMEQRKAEIAVQTGTWGLYKHFQIDWDEGAPPDQVKGTMLHDSSVLPFHYQLSHAPGQPSERYEPTTKMEPMTPHQVANQLWDMLWERSRSSGEIQ